MPIAHGTMIPPMTRKADLVPNTCIRRLPGRTEEAHATVSVARPPATNQVPLTVGNRGLVANRRALVEAAVDEIWALQKSVRTVRQLAVSTPQRARAASGEHADHGDYGRSAHRARASRMHSPPLYGVTFDHPARARRVLRTSCALGTDARGRREGSSALHQAPRRVRLRSRASLHAGSLCHRSLPVESGGRDERPTNFLLAADRKRAGRQARWGAAWLRCRCWGA
jgi:hypothetical protein